MFFVLSMNCSDPIDRAGQDFPDFVAPLAGGVARRHEVRHKLESLFVNSSIAGGGLRQA